MKRDISLVVIAVLSVLSCYLFYHNTLLRRANADLMLTQSTFVSESEAVKEQQTVTFYISGEVNNPGVYTLPRGSIISDAISSAGGKTEQASLDLMESPAKKIADGQKIYVPNVNDDIDKINSMAENKTSSKQKTGETVVNINTADIDELCELPGIGEATAKLIVEYRRANGDFKTLEEIKKVNRIGEKIFDGLKSFITIE